jgi:hypothetical protein
MQTISILDTYTEKQHKLNRMYRIQRVPWHSIQLFYLLGKLLTGQTCGSDNLNIRDDNEDAL